jgi:hypothetical protein
VTYRGLAIAAGGWYFGRILLVSSKSPESQHEGSQYECYDAFIGGFRLLQAFNTSLRD